MTRAKKVKRTRRVQATAHGRFPRGLAFFGVLAVVGAIAASALLWASGDGDGTFSCVGGADPGPVHVHGLGINPADDALFIATHTGLYRVDEGSAS